MVELFKALVTGKQLFFRPINCKNSKTNFFIYFYSILTEEKYCSGSNSPRFYHFCVRQFMPFFLIWFYSLFFSFSVYILAFYPVLGMQINRKRKQRSENYAEKEIANSETNRFPLLLYDNFCTYCNFYPLLVDQLDVTVEWVGRAKLSGTHVTNVDSLPSL